MARYIAANAFLGCFEFHPESFPNVSLLKPLDFLDDLPTLDDETTIYTVFDISDNEEWNELLEEYHVEFVPSIAKGSLFDLMSDPDWQPNLD